MGLLTRVDVLSFAVLRVFRLFLGVLAFVDDALYFLIDSLYLLADPILKF